MTARARRPSAAEQLAELARARDDARKDRVRWRRIGYEALDLLGELDAGAEPDALRRAVRRAQERAKELLEESPPSR